MRNQTPDLNYGSDNSTYVPGTCPENQRLTTNSSAPCDIVGDISYEELRATAYDDLKRGSSLQSIVAREQNLLNSKFMESGNLGKSDLVQQNLTPANQGSQPANSTSLQAANSLFSSSISSTSTSLQAGTSLFSSCKPTTTFSFSQPTTSFLSSSQPAPSLNWGLEWSSSKPTTSFRSSQLAPSLDSEFEWRLFKKGSLIPFQLGPHDGFPPPYSWEISSQSSSAIASSQNTQLNSTAAKAKPFSKTITEIFSNDDFQIPISIFKVPDSLSQANPDAYVPKLVSLGAIHHSRPEVQHMQMCKVMEAKRVHKGFKGVDFHKIVDFLKRILAPVRASYNVYLEITDDDLACILAVDGLFLLDLLCCYGIKKESLSNSSVLSQLLDSTGRRLAQETTLREAMMLENQIPILVLGIILIIEIDSSQFEIVSNRFPKILMGFCQFVSPLEIMVDYPLYKTLRHAHILDLLYHLIMLKGSPDHNPIEEEKELGLLKELFDKVKSATSSSAEKVYSSTFSSAFSEKSGKIFEQIINIAKDLAPLHLKKPIEFVQSVWSLPWSEELGLSVSSAMAKEPFEEETLIPRASELHKAGVTFVSEHITNIKFDPNRVSFHLPSIKISGNSEVIIRNLVAYETMMKSEREPLILTRYFDIMSGLISTSEDVNALKDHGIIRMESIDDEQVAKLFNGMGKSVRSTKTEDIDREIESIKSYYNSLWKVSARKFINKGLWIAGKWSRVFFAVLLLFLMGFQAFCSVYECRRLSFKNNSQDQQGLRVVSLRSYM